MSYSIRNKKEVQCSNDHLDKAVWGVMIQTWGLHAAELPLLVSYSWPTTTETLKNKWTNSSLNIKLNKKKKKQSIVQNSITTVSLTELLECQAGDETSESVSKNCFQLLISKCDLCLKLYKFTESFGGFFLSRSLRRDIHCVSALLYITTQIKSMKLSVSIWNTEILQRMWKFELILWHTSSSLTFVRLAVHFRLKYHIFCAAGSFSSKPALQCPPTVQVQCSICPVSVAVAQCCGFPGKHL